MIPKKIHFCWLGGGKYPERVRQCMESWREILPGYEIVRWDERRFDVNSVPWVREAVERKKYAFAADYIRHYALYHEGGIYLDTDVEVLKPFDDLLDAEMFAAIETEESVLARNVAEGRISETGEVLTDGLFPDMGLGLQSGAFGVAAGHPFTRRCLDWYESRRFICEDGTLYDKIIAPDIMAYHARPAGLKYKDVEQELDEGIRIHPSPTIAAYAEKAAPESYAIHHCLGSWRPAAPRRKKRWYSRWWKNTMRGLGLHK
nr:glycosyltransferase [uncultured Alistipes sp.]